MATQPKDDRLNIRINSDLKAQVYKSAQSQGISITDYVARVLTIYQKGERVSITLNGDGLIMHVDDINK